MTPRAGIPKVHASQGGVAQLGERSVRNAEVVSSILIASTKDYGHLEEVLGALFLLCGTDFRGLWHRLMWHRPKGGPKPPTRALVHADLCLIFRVGENVRDRHRLSLSVAVGQSDLTVLSIDSHPAV